MKYCCSCQTIVLVLLGCCSLGSAWLMPYRSTARKTNNNIGSRLYSSSEEGGKMGLNEVQTLFRKAVMVEDYVEAKKWSDELGSRLGREGEDDKEKKKRLSWRGLGTAPWLEDRLDAIGYKFPTTIQIQALESVNTLLTPKNGMEKDDDGATMEDLVNNSRGNGNLGVVISGSTGSGKTLAYLVPMLSTLSESLFTRQRIRVQSEESIADVANDFMARVAVQTSPTVRGHGRKQIKGGNNTTATSTMGKSGTDVQTPLALIVVPTRELGVQIALQLYQLVGGSIKQTPTEMSGLQNMFKYKGPKGVKIGCILDEKEASYGLAYNLLQTDVAITIPQYLPKLLEDGDILAEHLRVIVYDEADLCLEQTSNDNLRTLFNNHNSNDEKEEDDDDFISESQSRLTYLVGASVTKSLGELCVRDAVLPKGRSYIATATQYSPLQFSGEQKDETTTTTLQDLNACLDPGLRHELVSIPQGSAGLLCLTQLLRKELRDYENDLKHQKDNPSNGSNNGITLKKPRVVVFFSDEEQAKESIGKLRDAMWGDFQLCVLLPNIGVNPLQMMQDFKEGKTSVMLATPNSVRGLDFPDLTHVYTLYIPPDPREYLHLAGRVGRIGQVGSVTGKGGRVTTIINPTDTTQYQQMSEALNFTPIDIDATAITTNDNSSMDTDNVDDMRRYLEDKLTLLDLTNDLDVDLDEVEKQISLTRPNEDQTEEDDDDDDGIDNEFE